MTATIRVRAVQYNQQILEWNVLFHQTDVLTSMNVLKEVIIVIPMQLATIKEAHFIVNVTLVSKAVGLFVKILTNVP